VRDYLYESVADWFTDAQLNRLFTEEVRSLPAKDIYGESVYQTSLVVNQTDYTLPSNCAKVEKAEINNGTSSLSRWDDFTSWDTYNNALYLDYNPSTINTIRIFMKTKFTDVTDDVSLLDVPDDMCEIVVWGMVVRAYKMVIGYLRQSKNWDSVAKPDYLTLNTVSNWLSEARKDYNDLIKLYIIVSRPRDIDLTG
jgi:hypothetical protein